MFMLDIIYNGEIMEASAQHKRREISIWGAVALIIAASVAAFIAGGYYGVQLALNPPPP